jgi:uncharacterized caspase-like protein
MVRQIVLTAALILAAASLFPARLALVVGNAEYPDSPLQNPSRDAESVSAALKSLGFAVEKRLNLSYAAFDQAVRDFSAKLGSGDEALFYYSGHGAEVDGVNYLIPVHPRIESGIDCKEYAVSANWILGRMEQAGILVFVLDACRDNPFKGVRSSSKGLAAMNTKAGSTVLIYATEPGRVAQDGPGGSNSPFTRAFLDNLANDGTIDDMLIETSRDLLTLTNGSQKMWRAGTLNEYYSLKQGVIKQTRAPMETKPVADTLDYDIKLITASRGNADVEARFFIELSFPEFKGPDPRAERINRAIRQKLSTLIQSEEFYQTGLSYTGGDFADFVEKSVEAWYRQGREDNFIGSYLSAGLDVKLNGELVTVGGFYEPFYGGATSYAYPLYETYDPQGNSIWQQALIPERNRQQFEQLLINNFRLKSDMDMQVDNAYILDMANCYLVREGMLVYHMGFNPHFWHFFTIPRSEIYYLLSEEIRKMY